eukprot:3348562-Amphidinium_carterae.1
MGYFKVGAGDGGPPTHRAPTQDPRCLSIATAKALCIPRQRHGMRHCRAACLASNPSREREVLITSLDFAKTPAISFGMYHPELWPSLEAFLCTNIPCRRSSTCDHAAPSPPHLSYWLACTLL